MNNAQVDIKMFDACYNLLNILLSSLDFLLLCK